MTAIAYEIANQTTGYAWTHWTDEDLLLEYRSAGVREAFEELVKRYDKPLHHYLYRHLGNADSAEDAFQRTFMAVLKECSKFDASKAFRPWLYTIAANKAADHHRESKRFSVVSIDVPQENDRGDYSIADNVAGSEPEPFEDPMDREIASLVREAVAELPDTMRQAVYMIYFQGMTYHEAAKVLGVHRDTMAKRMRRAVAKLNFLLKNVG
ncbi:MAG: sigma-70 family RNA polymerase sigma factor [Planctomycetaceae bacterium]|nr:sigma-70 family RNA polymerase sigma factor [Planctomycetaceae bacterium]